MLGFSHILREVIGEGDDCREKYNVFSVVAFLSLIHTKHVPIQREGGRLHTLALPYFSKGNENQLV